MAAHLPQELIDGVIDLLHDDLPTLGACSLSCSAMLHRSRVHKLARMTVRASPIIGGETIDSEIAAYIRYLTAIGDYDGMWQEIFKCTNLRQLSIGSIHFTSFPQQALACKFPFPVLEKLELYSCSFVGPSSPNIAHFICAFPSLASLYIDDTQWPESWRDGIIEPLTHSPPFSGELQIVDRPQIIDILTSLPGGIRFRTITLESRGTMSRINTVVTACGSSLRKLHLVSMSWPEECEC